MNVSSFRALFSPLVLCVWGVVMLDIVFTGKIRTLLHPAFHPWVAITGASLLLVSIALVFAPGALHPEPWPTWFGRGGFCWSLSCSHSVLPPRLIPPTRL